MKRIVIVLVSITLLVVLAALKLSSNKKKQDEKLYIHDSSAAVLVEFDRLTMHEFDKSMRFLGTFEPNKQNVIGSDVAGKLVQLFITEGDMVKQGQVIAKIDDELLQLQLQNAQVNLENQKSDEARYAVLAKDNAIPAVQLEKTKLSVRSAEIQVKQAQKQVKSSTITAPYSGVISKKMVDLGSVIGPGSPLVEITDISTLKLTISVPERDILKFKKGQDVLVTSDIHEGKEFKGKVSSIGVTADKAHNFKIQVTVNNTSQDPLLAGMYGSVSLNNSQSTKALSVPRSALIGSSKNPQVYCIVNGKAELRSFTAGTSDGKYIEVVQGLSTSDKIITKGQINLQNGSNVAVKK